MYKRVRTRFAPSPTGYMHIGNLRTALFAYLIAKIDLYSDKELLRRADQRFSVWKAFSKCSWRFLRFYVVKGGFRDGKAGFTYAVLNACYKFATIAKIWERQSSED